MEKQKLILGEHYKMQKAKWISLWVYNKLLWLDTTSLRQTPDMTQKLKNMSQTKVRSCHKIKILTTVAILNLIIISITVRYVGKVAPIAPAPLGWCHSVIMPPSPTD